MNGTDGTTQRCWVAENPIVKRFISHSMPKSRGTFSAVSNHRKVKTVVANCGNQQHCTNYTVQGRKPE